MINCFDLVHHVLTCKAPPQARVHELTEDGNVQKIMMFHCEVKQKYTKVVIVLPQSSAALHQDLASLLEICRNSCWQTVLIWMRIDDLIQFASHDEDELDMLVLNIGWIHVLLKGRQQRSSEVFDLSCFPLQLRELVGFAHVHGQPDVIEPC